MEDKWQCRWASSLGELESTHEKTWGTKEYKNDKAPTVFFGMYSLKDLSALANHKGRKAILWAGSDIRHLINGYWIDAEGNIKLNPKVFSKWINKNCENWVENKVEQQALSQLGIISKVCPSFLGDVNQYKISYQWNEKPKLFASISGNDFELYCWPQIMELALRNHSIEFHLYGNTIYYPYAFSGNVIFHGRIPKEQMNEEIKTMQGAIRLLPFEGFSELIAKSLLWGQWPISIIPYPFTIKPESIDTLKYRKKPNIKGREWLLNKLNRFPWNIQK